MTETQLLNMTADGPQITHSVVVVTPEMARRWLAVNDNNRGRRPARILKYREDMETGRWTFAGDPVRFGVDGQLQDGQHRLLALAEADVSGIAFLVIRGLPVEARKVMDQGAKRTAGDQLTMLGHANANNLASAVKMFLTWERGYLFRDNKMVQAEIGAPAIEEWVSNHPTDVANYHVVCGATRRAEITPAISGAAFLIFQQIDAAMAVEFLNALGYAPGGHGDPTNALHQKLRRMKSARIVVPQRDVLAMFIRAWNAQRDGRKMTTIPGTPTAGWTPETFPVAR